MSHFKSSITLLFIILILLACESNEQLSECADDININYGLVLNAIRKNNFPKFSHYLNCVDDVNKEDENGLSLLMYSVGYIEFINSAPDYLKFSSGDSDFIDDPYPFVAALLEAIS